MFSCDTTRVRASKAPRVPRAAPMDSLFNVSVSHRDITARRCRTRHSRTLCQQSVTPLTFRRSDLEVTEVTPGRLYPPPMMSPKRWLTLTVVPECPITPARCPAASPDTFGFISFSPGLSAECCLLSVSTVWSAARGATWTAH